MSRIKKLESTDFPSIKKWFAETVEAIGGEGWHADDDPVEDPIINGRTGDTLFSDDEAELVNQTMDVIFAASSDWKDPDMIYHMAAMGSFPVEKLYPGIIIDASTPAGRLGYVTIPGREFPNLLVENGNQYAIVEFPQKTGLISEHSHFVLRAVDKLPGNYSENPRSIKIAESNPITFGDLSEIDDLVYQMAQGTAYRA